MNVYYSTTDLESNKGPHSAQKPYAISEYKREGRVVGWRVSIRRRGSHIDRRFGARQYGGMDRAFEAAIAFRDDLSWLGTIF